MPWRDGEEGTCRRLIGARIAADVDDPLRPGQGLSQARTGGEVHSVPTRRRDCVGAVAAQGLDDMTTGDSGAAEDHDLHRSPPPPDPHCGYSERTSPTRASQFPRGRDRKSTRLNSSHMSISYAVFCLKK